jgi:translation initiation factor 5A
MPTDDPNDDPKVEGLDKHEASHIKVKGFIMLKDRPCQVVKYSTAKPGKHGHVKVNLVAADILKADKKYQHMCTGHEAIEIPIIKKFVLNVLDIEMSRDGKNVSAESFTTMTEDDIEYVINFRGDDSKHVEALKLWKQIEDEELEDKEVQITLTKAICGNEKKGFHWEEMFEKVALVDVKD